MKNHLINLAKSEWGINSISFCGVQGPRLFFTLLFYKVTCKNCIRTKNYKYMQERNQTVLQKFSKKLP